MTHLVPEEVVEAADGVLAGARIQHLDECEICRRRVEEVTDLLKEAVSDPVPEPSPFFWEHLSARVRAAIDAEPALTRWWRRRPGWRVLVPAGAVAMVALAAGLTQLSERPAEPALQSVAQPPSVSFVPAPEPSPAGLDDRLERDDWQMVTDLVTSFDWETAGAAGLALEPGDAEAAVASLTSEERPELHRLLALELQRSKS